MQILPKSKKEEIPTSISGQGKTGSSNGFTFQILKIQKNVFCKTYHNKYRVAKGQTQIWHCPLEKLQKSDEMKTRIWHHRIKDINTKRNDSWRTDTTIWRELQSNKWQRSGSTKLKKEKFLHHYEEDKTTKETIKLATRSVTI